MCCLINNPVSSINIILLEKHIVRRNWWNSNSLWQLMFSLIYNRFSVMVRLFKKIFKDSCHWLRDISYIGLSLRWLKSLWRVIQGGRGVLWHSSWTINKGNHRSQISRFYFPNHKNKQVRLTHLNNLLLLLKECLKKPNC